MISVHAAVVLSSKGVMAVKSAPERPSNQSRRMSLASLAHAQPLLINDPHQPPPDIEICKLNFRFGSRAAPSRLVCVTYKTQHKNQKANQL